MRKNFKRGVGIIAPLLLTVGLSSTLFAEQLEAERAINQVLKQVQEDANQVQSQEWYGGVGFTTAKVSCQDGCEDITYGLLGRIGYDINNYIGIEGRVINTFLEYEQSDVTYYGIFAKPMYAINRDIKVYGLLGYGDVDVGDIKSYSGSGLSWGVGAEYYLGENREEKIAELREEYGEEDRHTVEEKREFTQTLQALAEDEEGNGLGIFLDYQRLIQKSDAPDIDTVNIGVVYDF